MILYRLLFCSLLCLSTALPAQSPKGCDLEGYFTQPSSRARRQIIAAGDQCIPGLIKVFDSSKDAAERLDSLNLMIASLGNNKQRELFFERLLEDPQNSHHELARVKIFKLAKSPTNLTLHKEVFTYLKNDKWSTDFSEFGLTGLIALETLFAQSDNRFLTWFCARELALQYPREAKEIFLEKVGALIKAARPLSYEEGVTSMTDAGNLLALLGPQSSEFLENFSGKVIAESFTWKDLQELQGVVLTQAFFGLDTLTPKLTQNLVEFYLPKTALTGRTGETDKDTAARIPRQLSFLNVLESMPAPLASDRDKLMLKYSNYLFSSDIPEFLGGLQLLVSNTKVMVGIATKLIASRKQHLVASGLRIIQLSPRGFWMNQPDNREILELMKLVQFYAQYGARANGFKIPENLRVAAAACLLRMKSAENHNLDSILSSLADTDPQLRITALELAAENSVRGGGLVESFVSVLKNDLDLSVKGRVLQLATDLMTNETGKKNQGRSILASAAFGRALLQSWTFADEALSLDAQRALELYSLGSPHRDMVLKEGLKSGNESVKTAAADALAGVVAVELSRIGDLLNTMSNNAASIRDSGSIYGKLDLHLKQVNYWITRKYLGDDLEESEEFLVKRVGLFLETMEKNALFLHDLSETGKNKKVRQLALDQLNAHKKSYEKLTAKMESGDVRDK